MARLRATIRDGKLETKTPSLTILCVDDEPGALLIRKTLLEHAGYKVLTAPNAVDALAVFTASNIDLVIADQNLPGVSGTELARQIKSAKPRTPILLLLGSWTERGAEGRDADKLLMRVEGPEKLLKTVADLLRYRRLRIAEGEYEALIACDSQQSPPVWHYVIQHGPTEIITWSQESTERAAVAAAKKYLASLNAKRVRR